MRIFVPYIGRGNKKEKDIGIEPHPIQISIATR